MLQWVTMSYKMLQTWTKTAQMAFKFLCVFRNIFEYIQNFSCSSKQFFQNVFFLQEFFHDNPEY